MVKVGICTSVGNEVGVIASNGMLVEVNSIAGTTDSIAVLLGEGVLELQGKIPSHQLAANAINVREINSTAPPRVATSQVVR